MSIGTSPISPELALVDSDLAAAARALLPDPGDCLAGRPVVEAHPPANGLPMSASVPAGERRRSSGGGGLERALAVAATFVLAAVVTAPLLAFLPPSQAPTLLDAPVPQRRSEPRDVEASVVGTRISWDPVPGSRFYNLVLVRGGQRVDFWPVAPSAAVIRERRREDSSRPFVTYSWFVYPAFSAGSRGFRYGTPVARGTIALRAGTLHPGTQSPR